MLEVLKITKGGGLAVFWKHGVDLSVDTYSSNHIDTIINQGKEHGWRFIGLYGEPETKKSPCFLDSIEKVELKIFDAMDLCQGLQ